MWKRRGVQKKKKREEREKIEKTSGKKGSAEASGVRE
jgi:hypothetical protein